MPKLTGRSVRELKRGINTEGWTGGPANGLGLKPSDFETFSHAGFDHVRLSLQTCEVPAALPRAIELIDAALENDLAVVFDLHWIIDEHGALMNVDTPAAVAIVHECWRALSRAFKDRYSNELMAYDLLNEPKGEQWNAVCRDLYLELRRLEPGRALIVGGPGGGVESLETFDVEWADENTILTFHIYQPYQLTHYRIPGASIGFYEGPIHYPGKPTHEEDLEALSSEQRETMEVDNVHYDAAHLAEWFSPAAAAAERCGLHVYCGEFGCNTSVPEELRLRWLRDMRAELEKLGFGWAVYSHKGRWRTVWNDDDSVNPDVVGALTADPTARAGISE